MNIFIVGSVDVFVKNSDTTVVLGLFERFINDSLTQCCD